MRSLARAVAAALAALALAAAPASAREAPPRTFAFLSHAEGVALERLAEFGRCVDVVAPNWYELRLPSARIGRRPPDRDIVALARQAGAELWPVVNGRFHGGGEAISRGAVRARVARRVAGLARRFSFSGITLDLEGLSPRLRGPYRRLVRRVDDRLDRERRRLAVYVPRRTAAPPTHWAAPYNWRGLSRAADLVLASGYNEHYSGGPPGPITTSAGFAAMLDYATSISRRRVAPALGAFGYHCRTPAAARS